MPACSSTVPGAPISLPPFCLTRTIFLSTYRLCSRAGGGETFWFWPVNPTLRHRHASLSPMPMHSMCCPVAADKPCDIVRSTFRWNQIGPVTLGMLSRLRCPLPPPHLILAPLVGPMIGATARAGTSLDRTGLSRHEAWHASVLSSLSSLVPFSTALSLLRAGVEARLTGRSGPGWYFVVSALRHAVLSLLRNHNHLHLGVRAAQSITCAHESRVAFQRLTP